MYFQQNGDPKHTAKVVRLWLAEQKFCVLKWPTQSPDLNPIENLWCIVKRRLAQYENPPTGIIELWSRVQSEWSKISPEIIKNLVESMPTRIQEVKKNKGLWTKY